MTIYTTSQSVPYAKTYGPGLARERVTLEAIVAVTAADMLDATDDEWGLFWVPKGFIPTGIRVVADSLDTDGSATLTIDIGDDADEDRLMAATSVAQAGGSDETLATAGFLYKYTARTLIKAYVHAVAATGADGTMKVVLYGVVDEEFDTTPLVAA